MPPLAVPQLGSCASSGRSWWPRAARHSQGGPRPPGPQPQPRVLELAASKVALSLRLSIQEPVDAQAFPDRRHALKPGQQDVWAEAQRMFQDKLAEKIAGGAQ